jgi:hypothetical protein
MCYVFFIFLDGFWMAFGWLLDGFWMAFGWLLAGFWMAFGGLGLYINICGYIY